MKSFTSPRAIIKLYLFKNRKKFSWIENKCIIFYFFNNQISVFFLKYNYYINMRQRKKYSKYEKKDISSKKIIFIKLSLKIHRTNTNFLIITRFFNFLYSYRWYRCKRVLQAGDSVAYCWLPLIVSKRSLLRSSNIPWLVSTDSQTQAKRNFISDLE